MYLFTITFAITFTLLFVFDLGKVFFGDYFEVEETMYSERVRCKYIEYRKSFFKLLICYFSQVC